MLLGSDRLKVVSWIPWQPLLSQCEEHILKCQVSFHWISHKNKIAKNQLWNNFQSISCSSFPAMLLFQAFLDCCVFVTPWFLSSSHSTNTQFNFSHYSISATSDKLATKYCWLDYTASQGGRVLWGLESPSTQQVRTVKDRCSDSRDYSSEVFLDGYTPFFAGLL